MFCSGTGSHDITHQCVWVYVLCVLQGAGWSVHSPLYYIFCVLHKVYTCLLCTLAVFVHESGVQCYLLGNFNLMCTCAHACFLVSIEETITSFRATD